jgi:hypothetical protein
VPGKVLARARHHHRRAELWLRRRCLLHHVVGRAQRDLATLERAAALLARQLSLARHLLTQLLEQRGLDQLWRVQRLAAARLVVTRSITFDMRKPSHKPSAASRASRPKSRRELAQDETPVAALAVAVVVPHDDREYGGSPPSEAILHRELVDDGRYLMRLEDKSTAESRVSNGAFTCQGTHYKLKPGVQPATFVWPDSTSQVLKDVEAERIALTLTWTTTSGALIRWTYLGS